MKSSSQKTEAGSQNLITNYQLLITNEDISGHFEKNLSGTLCNLSGTLCNLCGTLCNNNSGNQTNNLKYHNKFEKFFRRLSIFLFILLGLNFIGCNNSDKDPKASGIYESVNSGTITCLVDESVWDFMQPVFNMYDSAYKEINPTFTKVTSREAMAQLLAGNAKVIITPRNYLKDEDSLMKAFKVEPHERAIYAIDGLVFYVNKDFPLDSISDEQITNILSKPESKFKHYFPNLKNEPIFVCNDFTSSEYANLKSIVLNGEPVKNKIKLQQNSESVKKYVRENTNSIGIGYFSQIVKDTALKCLMISYVDSTGKYIFPHVVHQANILRKYYPYIVNHYVYILEKSRNREFWFAMFLEREYVVQLYFNNSGIVPAYAKIKLIDDEL